MIGMGKSRIALLLGVAVLAGCASGSQLPALTPGSASASALAPNTAPPACKGQKKTKHYASTNDVLSSKGGALCIPLFGAFGGSLEYPPASPSGKATATSSTTNYAKIPLPTGSGSPIFFLNVSPANGTTFGTTLKAGGGLTGSGIKANNTYTGYLEGYKFGFWYVISSCYAVAKSGKYGGVMLNLGSLLKGQNGYSAYEFFIYAGQSSGTKC
jgi:hypothetical protein